MGPQEHGTYISSVQRALRLVETVASSSRPLAVKALARTHDLTLGTAYNLVRTLVATGYLAQEPDGIVLGPRFPGLDAEEADGVALAVIRGSLHRVAAAFGATAYLARYQDGEVEIVDRVEAEHAPGLNLWVGLDDAAHATALGKQILAGLDEDGRLDYLSRHRLAGLTANTIRDRRTLLGQLAQGSDASTDLEEYAIGFNCVAVPIALPERVAALAVALPSGPLTGIERLRKAADRLRQDAARLSLDLGSRRLAGGIA